VPHYHGIYGFEAFVFYGVLVFLGSEFWIGVWVGALRFGLGLGIWELVFVSLGLFWDFGI